MFEYRIYDYIEDVRPPVGTPLSQHGAVRRQLLEEKLNELARQGWRTVSWDFEHYRVLLERAADSAHLDRPPRPDFADRWYPPQY